MRRWRRGTWWSRNPCPDVQPEPTIDESIDELLELAWVLDEEGESSLMELAARDGERFDADFAAAKSAGALIETEGGKFKLTPMGRQRARTIIRRHRLAEVLLTQILEMDESQMESDACRFEHILSPEATESVCCLLGHPPICPHGKPIPSGPCCAKFQKQMTPLVTPLVELHPGETGRIVFITPRSHLLLDRLTSLGIAPGCEVRLHQKRPAVIVQVGETDIAIDANVAQDIFVKRVQVQ